MRSPEQSKAIVGSTTNSPLANRKGPQNFTRRLPEPAPLPAPTGTSPKLVPAKTAATPCEGSCSATLEDGLEAIAAAAATSGSSGPAWSPAKLAPAEKGNSPVQGQQYVRVEEQDPGQIASGCFGSIWSDTRTLEEIVYSWFQPLIAFIMSYAVGEGPFQPLLTYLLIGCTVYHYVEGWAVLESTYFMFVTATTVGYGDMVPVTMVGKLFTSLYSVIGITVVLSALSPVVEVLRGKWREQLMGYLGLGFTAAVDTSNQSLTIMQVNAKINYKRRYAMALAGPFVVLILGMVLFYGTMRETPEPENVFLGVDVPALVDGFYWAAITMTTIGFGDLYPESQLARALVILYLPAAVISLADAVSDVQMIGLRRKIRETDFGQMVDECLLRDAVRGETMNLSPALSEAEFLVDQLVANGLVDTDAIAAIRRQFHHITRRGNFGRDEERTLTPKMVYEEIRARVKHSEDISPAAEACDVVWRNASKRKIKGQKPAPGQMIFRWANYDAWRDNSWERRVIAKMDAKLEEAEAKSRGKPAKGSIPTISFRSV